MTLTAWAEQVARNLLKAPLPRRWAHTQGVAAQARSLSPILTDNAALIEAAAWLHDVGYSPGLVATGLHSLDGARYLRDVENADGLLCRLVAHHTCAVNEADERGLRSALLREFPNPPSDLIDVLTYCDMTSGPDGKAVKVRERLSEITARYGPGHVVTRSIERSSPALLAAADRVEKRIEEVPR